MDYLGKGEMLTNRDVNELVHKIWAYVTFLRSFISAHESSTLHIAFIFFVQCIWLFFKLDQPWTNGKCDVPFSIGYVNSPEGSSEVTREQRKERASWWREDGEQMLREVIYGSVLVIPKPGEILETHTHGQNIISIQVYLTMTTFTVCIQPRNMV